MMALKRKALGDANMQSSKRSTPAPSTPISLDSDEDFSGSDIASQEASGSEAEHIKRARKRLDFSFFNVPVKSAKQNSIFGEKDFSSLPLKLDHDNRPLWVDPSVMAGSKKGPKITLESFSPLAAQATDLLTTVAEPQSRPTYLHEWRFTEHSLYAALSVGLIGDDIIKGLDRLSKTPLPENVIEFIKRHTKTYGKVRLVLRDNRFWVESQDEAVIRMLLDDPVIGSCRLAGAEVTQQTVQTKATVIQGTSDAKGLKQTTDQGQGSVEVPRDKIDDEAMIQALRDEDDEENTFKQMHSFEIDGKSRDKVAERLLDIGYPPLSEYDFSNDHVNPNLPIDLRAQTQIRPYQEKALSKMFGNGRGKSGIIVLPCGAGKTLVGITAACHIKKSVMVLCTSFTSVYQWGNEFKKWSDIKEDDIALFSAQEKKQFKRDAGVLVSTYSMMSERTKRSHDSAKMMDWISSKEWGLMILDEVHVVPANIFRKVTGTVRAHCKLGLTATLVREDDKVTDLNYIVGPKLYEANWMELADQGHIAKVQCAEVWCPMSMEFYQEYQKETTRKQALYYIMNPVKFQVCQFLIDYHEKRGDKIIVFSDNLFALKHYATKMKKAFIYGDTSNTERISILENFQHNELINTLFLSKIGDTSLDLPEATCLIQISSHYGSRRQEAQRLGRILRAKRRNDEGFNAFFYSLVSKDTSEMGFSAKRQAFLVDQGYAFKTITHLAGMDDMSGLAYKTLEERRELLAHVMLQQESAADTEKVPDNMWSHLSGGGGSAPRKPVQRRAGTLADASGGGTMAYLEQDRKTLRKQMGPESEYFKKEKRRADNARKRREKERREAAGE